MLARWFDGVEDGRVGEWIGGPKKVGVWETAVGFGVIGGINGTE